MPSAGDVGLLWKVSLAVWTGFAGVLAWVMGRMDKKVSKDLFDEFKVGNAMSHDRTHHQLKEIQQTQDKMFDKLDGKQDKKKGD